LRNASHWIQAPGPVTDGMRIGLLGGSFDPAHGGHLYISRIARKRLKLDYVWWLVSPGNPLKPEPAPLEVRMARARLLAHGERIIVTDLESRLNTRFTIDTIAALQRRFPKAAFVWLMGSDNLEQFSRWRRWQEIAARIPIAVVRRLDRCLPRCMPPWHGDLDCRGGSVSYLHWWCWTGRVPVRARRSFGPRLLVRRVRPC
jgi:nicotinic acid mononucleotide adenylyltransferase